MANRPRLLSFGLAVLAEDLYCLYWVLVHALLLRLGPGHLRAHPASWRRYPSKTQPVNELPGRLLLRKK